MEMIKVAHQQITSVMSLITDAIREMERNGVFQWDDVYPDQDILLADIDSGSLYSSLKDDTLIGIIAINESQSPEYLSIRWVDKGHPLCVHRLCIDPRFQGQGEAKRLMQFAENFGRENHYSSIRLDAFIDNKKAVGLYDSLNYQRRGIVEFRKGIFYCYEKLL